MTFDWVTTNTISVEIDVLGTVATSGSALYEVPNTPGVVSINLTAFDENVFEPIDATCSVTLNIEAPPTCDLFLASPGTIDGPGNVGLEWLTTGADTVSIDNGVGFVAEDGDQTVAVSTSTTYTLTAENTFGTTTCSVPVTVNEVVAPDPEPEPSSSSGGGGGRSINPRCEIMVDRPVVKAGDIVTVTWESVNAQTLLLSSLVSGQTSSLFSTTSTAKSSNGSYRVVVEDDTTFTLDVTRPNRSGDCSVKVTVDDSLGGPGSGDAAALISLLNLPETGFSPTAGFFVLINVFLVFGAALVAYVVVVFGQHYRRAFDRSHHSTTMFTPDWVRIARERSLLYARLVLWKWLAVVLFMISVSGFLILF